MVRSFKAAVDSLSVLEKVAQGKNKPGYRQTRHRDFLTKITLEPLALLYLCSPCRRALLTAF